MNRHTPTVGIAPFEVTTGPLAASRKVYTRPDEHSDVNVPFREIALGDPDEPTFRVYDTSGPYTEQNTAIDVDTGLPRRREAWVRARGGVETYVGREMRPEDNGNVSGNRLARDFPNKSAPLRSANGAPVTQFELARAGIITKSLALSAPPAVPNGLSRYVRSSLPRALVSAALRPVTLPA